VSLADSLTNAVPYKPSRPCGMRAVFEVLGKRDADALAVALSVPKGDPGRLSSQQLSDILESEGHKVSMKVIEIHRKGACSCGSRG